MSKGNTNRQIRRKVIETDLSKQKDKLVRRLRDACLVHVFLWAYLKYGKEITKKSLILAQDER